MNGVGFEILARTPVPKLPLSYILKEMLKAFFSFELKLKTLKKHQLHLTQTCTLVQCHRMHLFTSMIYG